MQRWWRQVEMRWPVARQLRRWLDGAIADDARAAVLPLLPLVAVGLLLLRLGGPLLLIPFLPLAAAILLFDCWRLLRVSRASSLRAARQYERVGRYMLPSDYHDSTHAALDAHRRRKAKAAVGSAPAKAIARPKAGAARLTRIPKLDKRLRRD